MPSEQPKPTSPGETAVGVATQTGPDVPAQLLDLPKIEDRKTQLRADIKALEDKGEFGGEWGRLTAELQLVGMMGVADAWRGSEILRAQEEGRDPNPLPWRVPENAQTAEAPASPGDAQGSNGLKLPQE